MAEFVSPRGTKDVLPQDTPKWQYVETKFKEVAGVYGFKEIRTPTFEHTELFSRNLGESTDVVSKEMYSFTDRGERNITLRPEGTAPAMRAYVQHNLGSILSVNKLYYIARLFRYERPQAGRYREHTQLGIEAVGSADPATDAEVISLAVSFFKKIGLKDYTLKLNSIGCPDCRPNYRKALLEFAQSIVGELCGTCANRYETNPMRMLDCKEPKCSSILLEAPKLTNYLCDSCAVHFNQVKKHLDNLDIKYILDHKLVRGFDYYTRTAFEFISGELGAQNAIGGGGRYDNMISELGGAPTPSIGFGIGLERLMLTLEALGIELPVIVSPKAYLVLAGEEAKLYGLPLAVKMREAGIFTEADYSGRSFKAQMKSVNKYNAAYAVIIGDNELNSKKASVKNMNTSEQTEVPFDKLIEYFNEL